MSDYLTVAEAAELLRVKPGTIRERMRLGIYRLGVHYFRPRGSRPLYQHWKGKGYGRFSYLAEGRHMADRGFYVDLQDRRFHLLQHSRTTLSDAVRGLNKCRT